MFPQKVPVVKTFHCTHIILSKVLLLLRTNNSYKSHLRIEKTRAIFPTALILFLMTSFLSASILAASDPGITWDQAKTKIRQALTKRGVSRITMYTSCVSCKLCTCKCYCNSRILIIRTPWFQTDN